MIKIGRLQSYWFGGIFVCVIYYVDKIDSKAPNNGYRSGNGTHMSFVLHVSNYYTLRCTAPMACDLNLKIAMLGYRTTLLRTSIPWKTTMTIISTSVFMHLLEYLKHGMIAITRYYDNLITHCSLHLMKVDRECVQIKCSQFPNWLQFVHL